MLVSSKLETYRATNRDLNIGKKLYVFSNQTTLNFKVTMLIQKRTNLFKSAIRRMNDKNMNSRFSPIHSRNAFARL